MIETGHIRIRTTEKTEAGPGGRERGGSILFCEAVRKGGSLGDPGRRQSQRLESLTLQQAPVRLEGQKRSKVQDKVLLKPLVFPLRAEGATEGLWAQGVA